MSLTITKNVTDVTTIALEGRLDTATSPELEKYMEECIDEIKDLVLDFENLEYISSAGLRVILKIYKNMSKKGSMKLVKVNETVAEVLDITGFTDFLNIE